MQRKDRLLEKRAKLVAQLALHSDAISGNLGKSAVPPYGAQLNWTLSAQINSLFLSHNYFQGYSMSEV